MKRARPKNKKAAMKKMREREEMLRMREMEENAPDDEISAYSAADIPTENTENALEDTLTEAEESTEDNVSETAAAEDAEADPTAVLEEAAADIEEIASKKEIQEEHNLYSNMTKEPKKKKKTTLKVFFGTFFTLVALLFIAMGFGIFDDTDILSPIEDGRINVLMLGVDEEGLRTDAIMVASYDVNAAKVHMISIPRDTKIYVENRKMTRKINEIHALSSKTDSGNILGAGATAEAVSQLTGISINYYVEFSFSAIDTLFDSLGPVEFDVPDVEGGGKGMNYDDPVQNLHIHLKPGPQKLSGNQVQQFLRYRKSNSGKSSGSDIDRVARQQGFVKAVIDQKVNPALLLKIPGIFSQISREIKTNVSVGDITKYVRYINKLSGESIVTYSLPGEAKTINGASYFVCDLAGTRELLREILGEDSELPELTDKITLSEKTSQSILKAGNMTKPAVKPEQTAAPQAAEAPKTSAPTKAPSKEPTKAPQVTKPPTKAPAVTKPPLEDMEDDVINIE